MNLPEDKYFKEVTKQVVTNSPICVRYWASFMQANSTDRDSFTRVVPQISFKQINFIKIQSIPLPVHSPTSKRRKRKVSDIAL